MQVSRDVEQRRDLRRHDQCESTADIMGEQ